MRRFRSIVAFEPNATPGRYRIMPFRFRRYPNKRVFLSSDSGEWLFLSASDFDAFVKGELRENTTAFKDLESRQLLVTHSPLVALAATATKTRTRYSFLDGFTGLHMFVVSLRCDHSCPYCQVSRVTADKTKFDMSAETAQIAVDWVFESPSPSIKIEFQGGEPLMALDRIKQVVDLANIRNEAEGRDLQYVITTNLSEVSADAIEFIKANDVLVSTSLDGPEWLHNKNRPRPGDDSYSRMRRNLDRVRDAIGEDRVAALMTTTETSLAIPEEIVDEYVRLGFHDIFIRPISPYGFAVRKAASQIYDADVFVRFYKRCLQRVFHWNKEGVRIVEAYAQLISRKMLTPFGTHYVDLQHPAGGGISAIVYNYDGDVYASDEGRMLAEMGDKTFRLGNVHESSYRDALGGDYLRQLVAQSCLQVVPQCSECAFLPYCGFDAAYNVATQRDYLGHRPTSGFCRKQMGIFDLMLGILGGEDTFERQVLTEWATY